MAFCPHCGKSVTEQAVKCAACNGELEARGKPARFKGTMMMSPGTAPLIQPPNAGQRNTAPAAQPSPGAAPAAPPPSASAPPSPIAATMPMPAVGPIADAAAAAMNKNPAALKATMLGTGDAGLAGIAQALKAQAQPQPIAPAAKPAPAPAATPLPDPLPSAPVPAATTRREVQAEDDSKRFLVGDPMAPKGGAEPAAAAPAPRPQRPTPRLSAEDMSTELPKDRSATFIIVGVVGVVVIAALGYIAAKLMGLTN